MIHSKKLAFVAATVLSVSFAAGCEAKKTASAGNDEAAVDDAISMKKRTDGDWNVVCQDGRNNNWQERATTADILNNAVCENGNTPPPAQDDFQYECIAKDGDGLAPYIFASVELGSVVGRITQFEYRSKSSCVDKLKSAVPFPRTKINFFCGSEDGDDLGPGWAVWKFNNVAAERTPLVYRSLSQCRESFSKKYIGRNGWAMCASKDKDGLAPFVRATIVNANVTVDNSREWRSLSSCQSGLDNLERPTHPLGGRTGNVRHTNPFVPQPEHIRVTEGHPAP